MRKVFIDCGAHKGQSVRYFRENFKDAREYEVHSFEPNTDLHDLLRLQKSKIHKEAVWIEDGEIDFYKAQQSQGATLVLGKTTANIDYDNPIKVPCISLSHWIKESFDKEDYIVLKLNVEGAEYEILFQMMRDKTIDYIDELYVEFHSNKIPGKKKFEEEIRNALGDKIIDWVILPNS